LEACREAQPDKLKPKPTMGNGTSARTNKQTNTSESDVLVDEDEELCSEQPYRDISTAWRSAELHVGTWYCQECSDVSCYVALLMTGGDAAISGSAQR
jgi:hypothetical protein